MTQNVQSVILIIIFNENDIFTRDSICSIRFTKVRICVKMQDFVSSKYEN